MKYLYDLFTGRHLRLLADMGKKQDADIDRFCATMNGEENWMLEREAKLDQRNNEES